MSAAERRPPARVRILQSGDREQAADAWRTLEAIGGRRSLTSSWIWTRTWLEHFGDAVPHAFALGEGDGPVAVALLTFSGDRLRGRTVHLGTAGEHRSASVYVERNAITALPGCEPEFAAGLLEALRARGGWNRIALDGFLPDAAAPFTAIGDWSEHLDDAPTCDLGQVRAAGGDVTAILSSSRRQRARRSLRAFGTLEEEWIDDPALLPDALDELAELNRARWAAAGTESPFAHPRFIGFHRALIQRLAPTGDAWIFRLRWEDATLASIYCLRDGGRVLFYQSGLRTPADNRLRPGVAVHVQAINACAARGLDVYDFLAPADRYKVDLATDAEPLLWTSTRRRSRLDPLRDVARAARSRARPSA